MCSKVAGHKKQKDFFKKILTSGRLSHSYIFSGISGTGKKLFARELARSILCSKGSFFSECDCQNCMHVKAGQSMKSVKKKDGVFRLVQTESARKSQRSLWAKLSNWLKQSLIM